ncbi:cell wall elongation regulator TseB-like domain-containing protein [Brevibacillus sp. SAFN-007a]|uniref:cell wall elongation regulator TseB-like domain-containing protein n=1 Tax=Brevibacillus sp. SAFN-007a TaxID=3436862 RepID=UPI003F80F624
MLVRIIVGAIIVLLVTGTGMTYHLTASVAGERKQFETTVREWVQTRTTIAEIESIDEYRGTESYAVVIGKNQAGTPVVAWMTAEKVTFDRMDLAVPRKNVEEAVSKAFPQSVITHIVPGLEKDKKFWEVTLKDANGRYRYLHYDLFSGALLASYVLSPT